MRFNNICLGLIDCEVMTTGPGVIARLAPETAELIAQGRVAHTKEVVKHRAVTLSALPAPRL